MKAIQFILFLVFISGSSILMINSGKISPQIEQQHNSYWTVIANAQSDPASGYNIPEPVSKIDHPESKKLAPPVDIKATRSTAYHPGYGRGSNAKRNLSNGSNSSVQSSSPNPPHSRIIESTLQPIDLIISPEEAANYAATLNTRMQYVTKR